jgi:hypothetical protein
MTLSSLTVTLPISLSPTWIPFRHLEGIQESIDSFIFKYLPSLNFIPFSYDKQGLKILKDTKNDGVKLIHGTGVPIFRVMFKMVGWRPKLGEYLGE